MSFHRARCPSRCDPEKRPEDRERSRRSASPEAERHRRSCQGRTGRHRAVRGQAVGYRNGSGFRASTARTGQPAHYVSKWRRQRRARFWRAGRRTRCRRCRLYRNHHRFAGHDQTHKSVREDPFWPRRQKPDDKLNAFVEAGKAAKLDIDLSADIESELWRNSFSSRPWRARPQACARPLVRLQQIPNCADSFAR